ncbi:MAG TPA: SPOR domain-containing protein, partial [Gammaproteobacteria bacterium]|nr:SPOR domain-containing protein [Gammaproteobacteria bacterium]
PAPPAAQPQPAKTETAVPSTPPPGWYIQVGSFSQRMNADGLRDRLQAAGHKTRLQTINIGKAQVYRVLVGPATSRASAEQVSSRLAKQQQIKGIVIEYPGPG